MIIVGWCMWKFFCTFVGRISKAKEDEERWRKADGRYGGVVYGGAHRCRHHGSERCEPLFHGWAGGLSGRGEGAHVGCAA